MAEVGAERYDDYVDYLELHGEEFAELFNTLLINVTGFFRDPPAWEYIAEEIVPQLARRRAPMTRRSGCGAPGAASGEEAYTVAMVLARVLGDAVFRERVKIYATDVDEEALDQRAAWRVPAAADRGRAATTRSSASSSGPTSATCSARTCAAA